MRRASAMVLVLFLGITGCGGTEAQVPFDGLIAKVPPSVAPALPAVPATTEPIASEPNVPWSIALLSDDRERPIKRVKRSGRVTIVHAEEPAVSVEPGAVAHGADVWVALAPGQADEKPVDEKPVSPKSCSGVVNRRS